MIRVIGFGNSLHGNDGFGEQIINSMKLGNAWPKVEFIFAGCAGLDAMHLFENVDETIVVDVIHSDAAKGDLEWYNKNEVIALDSGRNDHGMGLGYLFRALDSLNISSSIKCLLCKTDSPEVYTLSLDPEIDQRVDQTFKLLDQEIRNIMDQREVSIE